MPVKSEAQRRFMHAVKEGKVKGVSPSVGEEFLENEPKEGTIPKRKISKKSHKKSSKK